MDRKWPIGVLQRLKALVALNREPELVPNTHAGGSQLPLTPTAGKQKPWKYTHSMCIHLDPHTYTRNKSF